MPLPDTQIQERLSIAHCIAIISDAGFSYSIPENDFGTDLYILNVSHYDGRYIEDGALIACQVKSTTSASRHGDFIHYELSMDAYRRLKFRSSQPRFLVVYLLPGEREAWTRCSHEAFHMLNCAYWIAASEIPDGITNERSYTVRIPRENLLTPESVQAVIAPILAELEEEV